MRWLFLVFVLISTSAYSDGHPQPEAKKSHTTSNEKESITSAPITVQILPSPHAEEDAAKQEEYRKEKAEEDRSLAKATIWLAIVTTLLAIFTAFLWLSTRKLVMGAEETARKELRAYVATDDTFFVSYESATHLSPGLGGPSTITKYTNQLKIAIKNYGRTPAHRMKIHCECSFNTHDPRYKHGIAELLDAEQMLHPGQHLSFTIPTTNEFRPHTSRFYVIGYIIYCDIYSDWWTTNFCYRYESEGRFTPYGDQNCERGPSKHSPWR